MKITITISILILIIAPGKISSSTQAEYKSDKASVDLRIITFHWNDMNWGQSESDTITFCLYKNQEFVDNQFNFFFRIIEIIDSNTIEIMVPDRFEGLGNFPGSPIKNNSVIICGSNNCFRMKGIESKSDYCIDILNINF